ncbi:MAG: sulfite reductase (NADPH) hemoprotein beta-component [Rickettsiales bacterium]|jgi:sulfite reductase (NADPH) hemoprotein beta-component
MTEQIKINSNYLRGTLKEDLKNQVTGSINSDNHQLIKFHGIYEQDDRDRRKIRADKKLEKDYSFMIRLRIAGGKISSKQWLGCVEIADLNSTGTIKITTRQTIQLHGIIKSTLKPTVKFFDQFGLDSIAACGDVNRNVMSSAANVGSYLQDDLREFAVRISDEFLPKTNAFKEIWLDGEPIETPAPLQNESTGDPRKPNSLGGQNECSVLQNKDLVEPVYGKTYLPRKFKIVLALPPHNDVDVFAHDVGLIAITNGKEIQGFNVVVGGGMGMTHGNEKTYPRVGNEIGYVAKEHILQVVENILTTQRDFGNREDRKQARLKYTIDRLGLDWFKGELESRIGFNLEAAKPYEFKNRADIYNWFKDEKGQDNFTLFVENGRILGDVKNAMNEIAQRELADFNFTNNQNVVLAGISDKKAVEEILEKYNLVNNQSKSRQNSMACVALNTCPLALAEAQRYMPDLLTRIEELLAKNNLADEEISFRMTGCPNGCARPYLAEVGFVGKSMGHYNMYLSGSATGTRLNKLYKESLNEQQILSELDFWFKEFSKERQGNESFGDFTFRKLTIN